ncbi:Sec63-domain-containing protein [Dendrothele bispora CBS 962.96]|uniref:Sec63-domain-containing protein n=1 Tax=Dendrothele bispora (strain CBS 962.96) TaxID=1314807 RepID=A0A4S8MYZ2_DENBC|nr:Sec63-domain-containing protein [Dendrothele bispora CBS 962.96]
MTTSLVEHLELLVGTSDVHGEDKNVLDRWTRLDGTGKLSIEASAVEDVDAEDSLQESVLHVYQGALSSSSPLLAKLLSKANVEHLLEPLLSTLSSNRRDDEISADLAELIGFEDIELVMEIMHERSTFVETLRQYCLSIKNPTRVSEAGSNGDHPTSLSSKHARQRMEQKFRQNAARPLFSGTAELEPEVLPHVYTSSSISHGNILSHLGTKYMLPVDTRRETLEEYEEVIVPPARPVPPKSTERLIPVSELDQLCKGCFPGYSSLNRIQSIVYPTAYSTNENMLVCAPTGAGKTDVAMLTILRVLDQHRTPSSSNLDIGRTINRDSFKIIYVAPMKALASEIVRKFEKRLKWLSIQVRELTGDMQMTKSEIAQTQIIVTTPEKWDVVTRKPTGEGELAMSLKLLIIDEVHLLNDERGAVIETIVARTLRQVEATQSIIRIVGLSATLPNYKDVAEFLSASFQKGLFYFDSSFRPVPLEQHFIGIKGKPGSAQSKKSLDTVTFQKVSALVEQGHQVMVFVHARKETVKTAIALKEAALMEGNSENFSCEDHPQWGFFRRSIGESRNKEMKQLFDHGFGIHHAGMLRSDRNMMERMFEARAIKVLCCTATLAWGVNLPAHAVIIKGTQIYDSSKGSFVDLSVLDVLQVFGRAGRPGMESSGEGYICTTEDKLTHYLDAVTSQNPIESQFRMGIIDSLNAEISLGTVANVNDGVQWLGYTYLFVRMKKNPFVYGIDRDLLMEDPGLGSKRNEYITEAAKRLADVGMIVFDQRTHSFTITDLGRIAAKYYIRYRTIEIFNNDFRPKMTEADVLAMLSKSTEFDQIQLRDSEEAELKQLLEIVPCDVKGGIETSQGKVNILLQGYISRYIIEDFALVSDTAYVAQNAGRIVRALLEIAISRKWANVSGVLMGLSKAIEKRLWPYDQPLKQFDLKADIFYGLERWADEWAPAELAQQSAEELGNLIHLNAIHGKALLNAAKQFPTVKITYSLRPLGSDVLKIAVRVQRVFMWNNKIHSSAEPFWLWVEDHDGVSILQHTHLVFRSTVEALDIDFIIAIPSGQRPSFVTIRFLSDRWLAAEDELAVPLDELVMPGPSSNHTPLLDLPLLPISVLRDPVIEGALSNHNNFNAVQTQIFWSLLNTRSHSLICAPAGSGKTTMAYILAWTETLRSKSTWVLFVAPRKSSAFEMLSDLQSVSGLVDVTVELGAVGNMFHRPRNRTIRVASTTHLLRALSIRGPKLLDGLDLAICEGLDQMDASTELAISLLRYCTQCSPTRFVGISNSLNDATDLAEWLDVDQFSFHSFRPTDRGQSLRTSAQSFTVPQSAALFKVMAKPAHRIVQESFSTIVFIPSRSQSQPIARDLLTQCALETQSDRGYLGLEHTEDINFQLARLQDKSLVDFLSKGVGFFDGSITRDDRRLILRLFAEGIVRVLIVPREMCWSLPIRAATVVVMGTQYYQLASEGEERRLREYDLTELVRMQSRAIAQSSSGIGEFHLFCQSESRDTYMRFLNEGLPLESSLLGSAELKQWYEERKRQGDFANKQDLVDALSFTFLAQRVVTNPAYYDCESTSRGKNLSWIADQLDEQVSLASSETKPSSSSIQAAES